MLSGIDPDVIVVARPATRPPRGSRSSLDDRAHMLLTSVHANNAVATIQRPGEPGSQPAALISQSLHLVMVQRHGAQALLGCRKLDPPAPALLGTP